MNKIYTIILLVTFLCGLYSEEIYLPGDKLVIKVKYGSPELVISNNNQFMSIKLDQSNLGIGCKYHVWYGRIERKSTGEEIYILINEDSGEFISDKGMDSTLIFPDDNNKNGIIKSLYFQCDFGNKEFSYLNFPRDVKVAIGYNFP